MTDDPKSHETAQGARPSRDELLREHYAAPGYWADIRRGGPTLSPFPMSPDEAALLAWHDFTRSAIGGGRLQAGADEVGGWITGHPGDRVRVFCPQTAEDWIAAQEGPPQFADDWRTLAVGGIDFSTEPDRTAQVFKPVNSTAALVFDYALPAAKMRAIQRAIDQGAVASEDVVLFTTDEVDRIESFVRQAAADYRRVFEVPPRPQPPPPPPPQGWRGRGTLYVEGSRRWGKTAGMEAAAKAYDAQERHVRHRRAVVGGVLGFALAFLFFMLSGFVMGAHAAAWATVGLFIVGWTIVGSLAALAIGRPR